MKFDVVIGNPPFQETHGTGSRKDQASNLWSKFWVKGFDIANDQGIVAFITPTTWLSPSADLKGEDTRLGYNRLWDIFNCYSSYANVETVAEHFPGVGSSFGYVITDRSGNRGLTFSNNADTSLGFLPKSNPKLVAEELSKTNNIGERFKVDQANKPRLRVSVPMTRALVPESIEILDGSVNPTKGSEKPNLYMYVYVDTIDQAKMIQSRIIQCLEILTAHCRWSGYINIQILKMIKVPNE